MTLIALLFATLAVALHVVIFWMESVAWSGPAARKTFGPATNEEVAATRDLAFNQGFYNLFLAIMAAAGIVSYLAGSETVGATLVLAGTGSMLAAAIVLFVSNRPKRSAAIRQGTFPLVAVVAMLSVIL
jgi:putative membrane protein